MDTDFVGVCNKKKRIDWIDTMKALLIIAMVIGHSTSPMVIYIYIFHMPAFFVLSGYTYGGKNKTLAGFIKNKVVSLLLPALLINMIYIILLCIMQETGCYNVISTEIKMSFFERIVGLFTKLQTTEYGGATWFLFVLFEVEVIIKVIETILKKIKCDKYILYLIFILGGVGCALIEVHTILPYYLDLALVACLYFGIGLFFREKDLVECIDKKVMIPLCLIAVIFFGNYYFKNDIPMNWPTRDFSNIFIQLISCFASIYLVMYLSQKITCTKIGIYLQWIGKHTYCILITHFVVFRLLFGVGVLCGILPITQMKLLTPESSTAKNGGWIIISSLTIIICCVVAFVAKKNRWTNYLFNAKLVRKEKKNDKIS